MTVIVTDRGFAPDDWTAGFAALADLTPDARALDLPNTADPAAVAPHLGALNLIRIAFAAFNDGRGLTLARRLREMGFRGRLRAAGHLIADQYAMLRRSGFDEVEIDDALAARQPWPQWQARAAWDAPHYQSRLRA